MGWEREKISNPSKGERLGYYKGGFVCSFVRGKWQNPVDKESLRCRGLRLGDASRDRV